MKDTYVCDMCGGEFPKGWSDVEAKTESEEIWGDIPDDEKAVVCDDCFNMILPPN